MVSEKQYVLDIKKWRIEKHYDKQSLRRKKGEEEKGGGTNLERQEVTSGVSEGKSHDQTMSNRRYNLHSYKNIMVFQVQTNYKRCYGPGHGKYKVRESFIKI